MKDAVLLVTDAAAPSDVDAYVTRLFLAAARAGWPTAVLMDESPGADALHRALRELGAPVMRAPLYHRVHSEAARAAATAEALARFAPAVVHAVCSAPWTTVTPREIVLAQGLPLHFTEKFVAPGFTFTADLHARLVRLYRQARTVIAVSQSNAELLTRDYGLPGDNLIVIPDFAATPETGSPASSGAAVGAPGQDAAAENLRLTIARWENAGPRADASPIA